MTVPRPALLVLCLLAVGCDAPEPVGATNAPRRTRRESPPEPPAAPTRPAWDTEDRCPPGLRLAADAAPRCEHAGGPARLFAGGAGCAADLGGALPCDPFFERRLAVRGASASAPDAEPLSVAFEVEMDRARSDAFLCTCAWELRALEYSVETADDSIVASTEGDRMEVTRIEDGLRLEWRSIGAPNPLLAGQFGREVGLPPDEALEAALEDLARAIE